MPIPSFGQSVPEETRTLTEPTLQQGLSLLRLPIPPQVHDYLIVLPAYVGDVIDGVAT